MLSFSLRGNSLFLLGVFFRCWHLLQLAVVLWVIAPSGVFVAGGVCFRCLFLLDSLLYRTPINNKTTTPKPKHGKKHKFSDQTPKGTLGLKCEGGAGILYLRRAHNGGWFFLVPLGLEDLCTDKQGA